MELYATMPSLINHSKIPKQDLNTVQDCINQLKNLDVANTPLDTIKYILNKAFIGHILSLYVVPIEMCCYRAIRYSKKPVEISFLSYPPISITKAGRANRDNMPIFYAASQPIGALCEVNPKAGDKFVISKWQVKKAFQCQAMYDFFDIRERFHGNIKTTNELNNFIREYFSVQSKQSQNFSYNITIAMAEIMLSSDKIGGLIYPPANNLSKNTDLRFDNYEIGRASCRKRV